MTVAERMRRRGWIKRRPGTWFRKIAGVHVILIQYDPWLKDGESKIFALPFGRREIRVYLDNEGIPSMAQRAAAIVRSMR